MEFSPNANGVNPEGLEGAAFNIKAPDFHELLRQKCSFYMGKTKEAEPQAQAEVKKNVDSAWEQETG